MKSFSQEWERIHSSQEWGKYPNEQVIRFIARNYYKFEKPERKSIKLLDFGCGGGAHTWYLAREGFDVYAFDGSKSAVQRTEKYLQKEGFDNVHLSVQDGADINYDNDFFDCVIDNVCIYANKIEAIEKMYQNIYRILKNGGKIYSSCFGTKTKGYESGIRLEKNTYQNIQEGILKDRAITHFFTGEELKSVLETAGFKNVSIDYMLYTDQGIQTEMFFAVADK